MYENDYDEAYIKYLQKHGKMERGYVAGFAPSEDTLEQENKKLRDHISNSYDCGGIVRGSKPRVLWEYVDDELVSLTATGFGCDCGRFPAGTIEYRLDGDLESIESIVEG